MKLRVLVQFVAVAASLAGALPAYAQSPMNAPAFNPADNIDRDPNFGSAPAIQPAGPSSKGGRIVAPFPAMPGRVPVLPNAHKCAAQEIQGLWKLMMVYEEPSGA